MKQSQMMFFLIACLLSLIIFSKFSAGQKVEANYSRVRGVRITNGRTKAEQLQSA